MRACCEIAIRIALRESLYDGLEVRRTWFLLFWYEMVLSMNQRLAPCRSVFWCISCVSWFPYIRLVAAKAALGLRGSFFRVRARLVCGFAALGQILVLCWRSWFTDGIMRLLLANRWLHFVTLPCLADSISGPISGEPFVSFLCSPLRVATLSLRLLATRLQSECRRGGNRPTASRHHISVNTVVSYAGGHACGQHLCLEISRLRF